MRSHSAAAAAFDLGLQRKQGSSEMRVNQTLCADANEGAAELPMLVKLFTQVEQ